MPVIAELTLINLEMRRAVIVLRYQRRRLCLLARRIANLLMLPNPALLRLVHILAKSSLLHHTIIAHISTKVKHFQTITPML